MNVRRGMTVLLAATLAVTPLAGCARQAALPPSQPAAQTASPTPAAAPAAPAAAPAAPTAPAARGVQAAGLSASDRAAIDAELSAIGRDLDGLDMPSDSDFSSAQSAAR